MESGILKFWKEHDTFQKSMKQREGQPGYVFYEGPPTANGLPGIHHVLARVFKDLFPRYQTMKGYYCARKGGWDTHGLPVELEVEKELGFSGKKAIEQYGVAAFNQKCRESVFRYVHEWELLTDRIGFWVDLEHAYVTLKNEYIESVWWILKQLWDKDLIYQGYKVVPYCPRCGTPLSDHEVAQGYRETEDPSIYVKFPVKDEPGHLLPGLDDDALDAARQRGAGRAPERGLRAGRAWRGDETERLILASDLLGEALRRARLPDPERDEGPRAARASAISRSSPSCRSTRTTATSSPATSSPPRKARASSTSRRRSAPTT